MRAAVFAWAAVCFVLGGCRTAKERSESEILKPSLELKAVQEREFESDKQTVFASTVSVLQDMGYLVKTSDYRGGLMTAEKPQDIRRNALFTRNKTVRQMKVTAFVDGLPGKTTVRLNFVVNRFEWFFGREKEEETVILDSEVYARVFDKIGETIFLRKGMN